MGLKPAKGKSWQAEKCLAETVFTDVLPIDAKIRGLLIHHNAPLMGRITVHDVDQPLLDRAGVSATVAIHRNINIATAEVDQSHRSNEESSSSRKGFDEPAFLMRLDQFVHSKPSLNHLYRLQTVPLSSKSLLSQINNRSARDTLKNNPLVQRRGDQLQLPRLLRANHDEEITRPGLRHKRLLPKQPQHLIKPPRSRLALRNQRRPIIRPDLSIPKPTRPGSNRVLRRSQQLQPNKPLLLLLSLSSIRTPIQRRRRRRRQTPRHIRETRNDDIQQRLLRPLHAQCLLGGNKRRPHIKKTPLPLL